MIILNFLLSSAAVASSTFSVDAFSLANLPRPKTQIGSTSTNSPIDLTASSIISTGTHTCNPIDEVVYNGDPSDPKCNVDDEYDAIVIGSGMGGMTTASLLAQSPERLKVLLLEQHSVCGGCCHTFRRGPYAFPTGIHYVGEMNRGGNLRKILDPLTYDPRNDPLEWDPLGENFDTIVLGEAGKNMRQYKIVGDGLEVQRVALKKQFKTAQEHEAIDKYYDHIEKANAAMARAHVLKCLPLPMTKFLRLSGLHRLFARNFRKYSSMTLADMVNSLTDNDDLRSVLSYSWDCYGCEPSRVAFIMHAQIVRHYSTGAFFPRGGPREIAKKILPTITSSGGAALARAPVKNIVVDDDTGRAVGVEMMDGKVIKAKRAVVSDAGVMNTLQHLLPKDFKRRDKLFKKFFPKQQSSEPSLHEGSSALNLFVGLRGDHDMDFNLPLNGNIWAFPTSSVEDHVAVLEGLALKEAVETLEPKDIGHIFITSSSCKDTSWRDEHPDRTVLEIMTSCPQKWFEEYTPDHHPLSEGASDPGGKPGSHGKQYEELKLKLSRLIWYRVVEVLTSMGATNLPESLDDADYFEVGTPLTFAHFYFRDNGGFYGLDHDVQRFSPRNYYEVLRPLISEVPGLYLTGQDVTTCGIGGALSGGVLAAGSVLGAANPFSLYDDIEEKD